jgi:carboxyl-terminal processing protease
MNNEEIKKSEEYKGVKSIVNSSNDNNPEQTCITKSTKKYSKWNMKGFGYNLLAIALLTGVFYFGVAWGKHLSEANIVDNDTTDFIQRLSNPRDIFAKDPEVNKPDKVSFDIFWDVWRKVNNDYVSQDVTKDTEKRVFGAVKGMVSSLGDPYSVFFDPEESRAFTTELEGKFIGIGAELTLRDNVLTVVAPIEGMPAEKAGILAGDKILKIYDELTNDMTTEDAVKKIRGEKGTEVVLTVLHKKDKGTTEIKITRDEIDIKSIAYEKKENGIAYLRIKGFMDDTAEELDKVSSEIIADNTKGLIVDVRSNPGGNLDVAVDIISKFVPKGEVVLWERDKNNQEKPYRAIGGEEFKDLPVVVLIDGGSASASEILAGALRDINSNLLIGEKTFGKGSVQSFEKLSGGASLKMTIAKWLTPIKQSIHEIGIEPTIKVELSLDDIRSNNDKQLKRAMEELKKQIDAASQKVSVKKQN